jgi:hypothetical protein
MLYPSSVVVVVGLLAGGQAARCPPTDAAVDDALSIHRCGGCAGYWLKLLCSGMVVDRRIGYIRSSVLRPLGRLTFLCSCKEK